MKNSPAEGIEKYDMSRRQFLRLTSLSAAGFVVGCAVNPVTGEKQFMLMSEQQEIQIDKQNSPHQFSADYGIMQDRTLISYVDQVGKKLAQRSHRPNMPYSFQPVNATYVNAYAFPGGSIALTRGILLKLDNEAELAALLGHELGHVNARHTAEQMSKGTLLSMIVGLGQAYIGTTQYSKYTDLAGQLGQLGTGALLASYSRDNEREADGLGNQYMVQGGYNTAGFVGLMDMLKSLSKHKANSVELLFSTHPMSNERYRTALENAASKYQTSKNLPMNKERYMDSIGRLRAIRGAIEDMQKGEAAMAQKKYNDAESFFQGALRKSPRDYAGLTLMAKCQFVQEKYGNARRYADKAGQVYPREPQSHHISGLSNLRENHFESAYQNFATSEKLLPGNPNTAFFKGYSLEGMQRTKEAANEYKQYLQAVNKGEQAKHAYQRLVEWGYVKQKK